MHGTSNRISHLGLWILAAVALASSSLACGRDTYLEVQLTGSGLPQIQYIAVDLTLVSPDAGAVHSHDMISGDDKGPITLPASMAFKLDSEEGTLTVLATALNAQNQQLATASKTTTIMHAQTWTIQLTFAATSALTNASDGGI